MRIITIRQPWADAIIWGGKDVENRPRNIAGDYRGPVLIHAGKHRPNANEIDAYLTTHADADARIVATAPDLHPRFGEIIGVVDIVGAHKWPDCQTDTHQTCSEWAYADGVHLELANPRALATTIPWKGALGLRSTDFQIAASSLYAPTGVCGCPAGVALGETIGHAPGCGLVEVTRLTEAPFASARAE